MRIITISSGSESEDDVPLRVVQKEHQEDPNSYSSLCRKSFEACEFCDKISKSRYSSLIHNVKHIIIPLLNQTIVQCKTCLHHFTSQEDLRRHSLEKHNNATVHITLTKLEPIYFGSRTAGERTVSSNNLEIKPFTRPNNEVQISENVSVESDATNVSIKNRLLFEDDLIVLNCDRLLNDLTTDCKVNLEPFETPWLNEVYSASVHYDELVKPGVYRCKKCGKGFPIRYDAIIHETSHLMFKNSKISHCNICNEYIEGDIIKLKRHYLNYHKGKYKTKINIDKYYVPYKKNNVANEKNDSKQKSFVSKILNLCEICFSFCKSKGSVNYEFLRTVSELGRRYKCEKCGVHFFEIHLVKRRWQKRVNNHHKKKIKSNEDRLKLIKNRFKMLKH